MESLSRSNFSESLFEISNEVFDVLDADGHTDEVVLNSQHLPVSRRHRAVGHEGGVLDERLDAAKTLRKREQVKALEQSFGVFDSSLHVERDHGTRSSALLLCNVILGVARQSRVDDPLNFAVAFEEFRDGHSVLHGLVDAHFEGFAGAHGQPGIEGIKTRAHSLQHEVEFVVELAVIKADASSDHI